MTSDAERILKDYLKTEFDYEEAQQAILDFVLSQNIRSGEYVGNEYVLKKLDFYNFLIFSECIDRNEVDISRYNIAVFSKDELVEAMTQK